VAAQVLERRPTEHGELVLRRGEDGQLELIMNGVFLMSTANGPSERELVRAALGVPGHGTTVLIGGLGAGFSLAEALATPRVSGVVVVESEPDVIAWGRTYFRPCNEGALDDPRVTVVQADLAEYAATAPGQSFDAICLDTDNGPDWLSRPGNAALYARAGLERLRDLLRPRGRLAVWAAAESPAFADRLAALFASNDVKRIPVGRGPDDIIYLASR
jgi:spermidine synthase